MDKKRILTTETVFPIIVGGLSLLNLIDHKNDFLVLSSLLSLVGLAGAILFFQKNEQFKKLIYIWILAQLIVIDPFFDLTQVFSFKLGFNFTTSSNEYGINLNVLAIVYFGLLKILKVSSLVGKQLTFKQFRQDNRLGEIFPINGTVVKRVMLSKEKDWLLVQLANSFNWDEKSISHVVVRSKDGETIKPNTKNQIVYFRLVSDIREVTDGDNDSSKFPFVDWAICN